MPVYISLMRLSDKGARKYKKAAPAYKGAKAAIEAAGGKLLHLFATMGRYDYVGIAELPDDNAAFKALVPMAKIAGVRCETLKAVPFEEFKGILESLKKPKKEEPEEPEE